MNLEVELKNLKKLTVEEKEFKLKMLNKEIIILENAVDRLDDVLKDLEDKKEDLVNETNALYALVISLEQDLDL